jgi:hypothetical protein
VPGDPTLSLQFGAELARRTEFHIVRKEALVDRVRAPLDNDTVRFSMNRDITPSSPHPLSAVANTKAIATKNPRIMFSAIWYWLER